MSKALTVELVCIQLRSGIELWVEKVRAANLIAVLSDPKTAPPPFVRVDAELINVKDVVGVFSAATMEDSTHRKNGEWRCRDRNAWHAKGEKCDCVPLPKKELIEASTKAINDCGECQAGYVFDKAKDAMVPHDCLLPFMERSG